MPDDKTEHDDKRKQQAYSLIDTVAVPMCFMVRIQSFLPQIHSRILDNVHPSSVVEKYPLKKSPINRQTKLLASLQLCIFC